MSLENHYSHCGIQWTLTDCDSAHNDECESCHGEIMPLASTVYSASGSDLVTPSAVPAPIHIGRLIALMQHSEGVEIEILKGILDIAAKHLDSNTIAQKEIAQSVLDTLSANEVDTSGEDYSDLGILSFFAAFDPEVKDDSPNVIVNVTQRISAIVEEEIVYSIDSKIWNKLLDDNDGDEEAAFSTAEFQNNRQRVSLDQDVQDQTCVHELTLSVDAPIYEVGV
jgi:hypothetical protein